MLDHVAFGIIIGLLFVCLLVLFCVLLVKLHIRKVNNYTKVIYQKDIDFQKTLNATIIETQEQLFNNISQDLHDDVGQQITSINFMIENLKLDTHQLEETLQPVSEYIFKLSNTIRAISHSLNNQSLLQQDLFKAIEAEVKRLQKNNRVKISYTFRREKDKIFNTNEKIVLYRIFQEVLNNIFKHSKATIIEIELSSSPGFTMRIRDNGQGFDYSTMKKSNKTLGLHNIVSRADIINYNANIQSAPGMGTTIILSENIVS